MLTLKKRLLFLFMVMCVANGCISDEEVVRRTAAISAGADRVRIDPVITAFGVTGRSVLACPTGKCIILHYPPADLDAPDLAKVLDSDPSTHEDDGELYSEPGNPWCNASETAESSTFNCCTFAVGDVVGLTPSDWVNPVPSGNTENANPLNVLLDSYFRRLKVYRGPKLNWEVMEHDDILRDNDVLCYVQTGAETYECVHVGKVCKSGGKNWLVSKFGFGPIVKATISATGSQFTGHFNEVWVYRSKTETVWPTM